MEQKIKELEEQIKQLKAENQELKESGNVSEYFTTTDANSDTTDTEAEEKRRVRWKKKMTKKSSDKKQEKKRSSKKKEETLSRVLNRHQEILQGLGDKALTKDEDGYLKELINSLSKTSIIRAMRDHQGTAPAPYQVVDPPELPENQAPANVLKDSISSLKDVYRTPLQGKENEDIAGYLRTASELARDNKLNKKQFFILLKSRITMGSDIYYDIMNHEMNDSSLRVVFKELLPLYSNYKTYLSCFNKLNSYKPTAGTPPNQVLAHLKTLATELMNTTKTSDKRDFVYQHVRNKILYLYPDIANKIIEKESVTNSKDIGSFTRIFLSVAPFTEEKRHSRRSVHEVDEDGSSNDQTNLNVHVIKISKSIAERFRDKCYKVKIYIDYHTKISLVIQINIFSRFGNLNLFHFYL